MDENGKKMKRKRTRKKSMDDEEMIRIQVGEEGLSEELPPKVKCINVGSFQTSKAFFLNHFTIRVTKESFYNSNIYRNN